MIRLAVCGAAGRMGSRIIALAKGDKELSVKLALERPDYSDSPVKIQGLAITYDTSKFSQVDCVVDFTQPQATLEHLKTCVALKRPMVIGTTGFSEQETKTIADAARVIPVVFSPNMSIGVNLVFKVVKDMATTLKDYKVRIIEAHHVHKKDAPSGTAKKIAEIIESCTDKKVEDIKSIREGEIVGEHEVIFESEFDTVSLKHCAKSRDVLALGALTAAKWVVTKEKGLFNMQDCLFGHEK